MKETADSSDAAMKGIRLLSYILMASGIFLLLPYPLGVICRFLGVSKPGSFLVAFVILGDILMLAPLLTISLTAIWVYKKTGDHGLKFDVMKLSALRYAPALATVVAIHLYGRISVYSPALCGAALVTYAGYLMYSDGQGVRFEDED
jgi:hypothetical protein